MTGSGVPERRSSPGGNAVAGSLAAVGYHQPRSVALVETARPRVRGHEVVLSQNAWNYVSCDEFSILAAPYARPRRVLYRARRAVAAVNTRRAATNVVLSNTMADLLRPRGIRAVVSPVTLPVDLCQTEDLSVAAPEGIDSPFVLVPGTLTPYKNADHTIALLSLLDPRERPLLVLAGTDDGSGHQQVLERELASAGIRFTVGPVSRPEMTWLLMHAAATVIASRLESLSFSVAEALALSPRVLASPLPVHREVARRLGREPQWLTEHPDRAAARALTGPEDDVPGIDRSAFRSEWDELAALLTASVEG